MALFTDGPISSIDDLCARDSQLLSVASSEGIDVTQKIWLAQEEIGLELKTLLDSLSSTGGPLWVATQNVGNVVVTPALKLWHGLRSLDLVYGDAFNSQLNDRYAGKRDQFHAMAAWAYERLVDTGIGITNCPVSKAAMPTVTMSVGEAVPDGTYYVTTSWINSRGEEGVCADPTTIATAGCTFVVQPASAPPNASGWNVYAGSGLDDLWLQNGVPLAMGTNWFQPTVLITSGTAPSDGQSPNYVKPVPRLIQRG
ncbi:MAG TPA: hypothetical protein VKU19_25740 [Bryobacteraceae bacterium]|nr:hypothetical protein [Bryobacteraceae bacterium]